MALVELVLDFIWWSQFRQFAAVKINEDVGKRI